MLRYHTISSYIILVVFSVFISATILRGQSVDYDDLAAQATSGEAAAQLQYGKALLFGSAGVPEDRDRGLELIAKASAQEYVPAQAFLGKVFLDGFYVEAKPEMGLSLLRKSAEAGDTLANETLGDALLWGLGTPADPEAARGYLQVAAEGGSTKAMRQLGEQLIHGWTLEKDVAAGLVLLEQAAASNDAEAQAKLGELLYYGELVPKDTARAESLFEAAAANGNGDGLYILGSDLMWKGGTPDRARALLERSGALGTAAAWTALAEGGMYGYLEDGRGRTFRKYAPKARAAGETKVAVLEAQRRLYGISMRASAPDAISTLEQAARNGNADAARFLISLVRDGNRYNVRKSPEQAAAYLAEFGEILGDDDRERLAFTLKTARTREIEDYPGLVTAYEDLSELKSARFGRDIYASNPNFGIYLLQVRLNEIGENVGTPDGYAGTRTLRALWKACLTLPDTTRCYDTIMHPTVIGRLIAR